MFVYIDRWYRDGSRSFILIGRGIKAGVVFLPSLLVRGRVLVMMARGMKKEVWMEKREKTEQSTVWEEDSLISVAGVGRGSRRCGSGS